MSEDGCVICGSSEPSPQGGLCPKHTYDCERCGHPENSFACKIRHQGQPIIRWGKAADS